MPWDSVGTQQAQGGETGEMRALPEEARARTLVLSWGVGLVGAEKGQIQFRLGITYNMNSGEPESDWPTFPYAL